MKDDDTLPFTEEDCRTILTNKADATVSYESLRSEIALAYNRSKAEPTGDSTLDSKTNLDKYKANIKLAEMAVIVGDASVKKNDHNKACGCYMQAQQFFELAKKYKPHLQKKQPSDLQKKLLSVTRKLDRVARIHNGELQKKKMAPEILKLDFEIAFDLVSQNPEQRPKDFLGMKVTAGSKPNRSIEEYDFYSKMSVSPFKRALSKTALRFFLLKSRLPRLPENLFGTVKAPVVLVVLLTAILLTLILSRGDIDYLEGTTESAYDNIVKPFLEVFTDLLLLASVALSILVVPAETAYGRFFEHKLNLGENYSENLSEYTKIENTEINTDDLGNDAYKSLSLNNAPDQVQPESDITAPAMEKPETPEDIQIQRPIKREEEQYVDFQKAISQCRGDENAVAKQISDNPTANTSDNPTADRGKGNSTLK
tara:strand:- start:109 stop:1386 length:1278 start_codon:yes stop_codon:yes gene_type:complete